MFTTFVTYELFEWDFNPAPVLAAFGQKSTRFMNLKIGFPNIYLISYSLVNSELVIQILLGIYFKCYTIVNA